MLECLGRLTGHMDRVAGQERAVIARILAVYRGGIQITARRKAQKMAHIRERNHFQMRRALLADRLGVAPGGVDGFNCEGKSLLRTSLIASPFPAGFYRALKYTT